MFNINIIKSLLFIIVLIFLKEVYKNILKIKEFGTKHIESFSCQTGHLKKKNNFLVDIKDDSSTEHSAYKPYRPEFQHYGNRIYSYQEGYHRNQQDTLNVERIKKTLSENKKLTKRQREQLQQELTLEEWKKYIFKKTKTDNTQRNENDIRTDYEPNNLGCQRMWLECGSRNNYHLRYKTPESYYSQKQFINYYNR